MRLPVALLASTAVALSGCAHTVSGAALRNVGGPVTGMQPEATGDVLLSPGQVHEIVGSPVQVDADRARPVSGSSPVPVCSALDTVGMSAFVGEGWSGCRVLLLTAAARRDRGVAEAVAVYPDPAAAAAAFRAGTKDARACDGQHTPRTASAAQWKFSVPERNADTVRWTKRQLAIPMTWVCHGEGRLRNNAVVQAMACQGDDGGQAVVTSLSDRMSASVWELSGR